MKKIFFITALTCLTLLTSCSNEKGATITGSVDRWTESSRLILGIMAEETQDPIMAEIPVRNDGTFSYHQKVEKPTVASIIINNPGTGMNRISLFLENGKTVNVDLKHVKEAEGEAYGIEPTFTGDTKAESEFVNENKSIDPRDFETFTAFKDSIDKYYAERLVRAKAIGNPAFEKDYIAIYDPMNQNARLVNYIPHDANLDSVETAYMDYINQLDFNDPVNENALQQYLITYGRFVQKKKEGGSATMPSLEELTRRTQNQTMLNNISSHLMFFFLMIDTPYVESVWAKYTEICKDESQINELRPRYEARKSDLEKVRNKAIPKNAH